MFAAFLATILFSLSVVFATRTTRLLGAMRANFYRLCVSTVLLALWAHTFGKGFGGGAFWIFFLSGCIGFGLGDIALYMSIPRLGPRLAILMVQCLAAPFGALAEWLWLGTDLSTDEILSSVVILAGVGIAVSPREHLHIPRGVLIVGLVMGAFAALGQGLGAVVSRKAYLVVEAAGQSIDGGTAAYQRILGGLIFAGVPLLLLMRRNRENGAGVLGRDPWRAARPWVLLNALAGAVLGVGCYQWALETTPSGIVLPIVATTPIVVIPFAYLLERDVPGPRSIAGGVIAVAGAIALTLVH